MNILHCYCVVGSLITCVLRVDQEVGSYKMLLEFCGTS